ncbi:mas-related G-protein coupled receptor member E [Ctenodactylus gundi]
MGAYFRGVSLPSPPTQPLAAFLIRRGEGQGEWVPAYETQMSLWLQGPQEAETSAGTFSLPASHRPLTRLRMEWGDARKHAVFRDSTQGDVAFNLVVLSLTEFISLAGLLGNGVVLWLLVRNVYRNPFSVYLLDVTCADLIFLCCHVVAVIPDLLPSQLSLPSSVQTILVTLRFFCYIVGLSLLAAISTEQCLAALLPAWYLCRRPRYLTTCVCALIWALCLLLDLMLTGACTLFLGESSGHLCWCLWLVVVTLLAVLCFTMCIASLLLLLWMECSPQHQEPRSFPALVLLMVLLFLFCGLPFGIYWLSQKLQWHTPHYFYHLSFLTASVHSAAKPAIYFCLGSTRGHRLREPLRLVFRRALGDEAELGTGRETSRRDLVDITA